MEKKINKMYLHKLVYELIDISLEQRKIRPWHAQKGMRIEETKKFFKYQEKGTKDFHSSRSTHTRDNAQIHLQDVASSSFAPFH